jgi:hypothetical protein
VRQILCAQDLVRAISCAGPLSCALKISFFSTHSCAYNEAIGNHFGGSFSISSVDMDADGGKCTNYDAL